MLGVILAEGFRPSSLMVAPVRLHGESYDARRRSASGWYLVFCKYDF